MTRAGPSPVTGTSSAAARATTGPAQALWKIARDEAYRLQAVAALEPVLRSTREWTELVELLELRLQVEETPGVRLEILTEIARIREQEQNDSRRAFDAWALAFAEEPSEAGPREALERLAAVHRTNSPSWRRCTAAGWRATWIPSWSRRWPGGWRSCTRSSWASRARRWSSCGGSSACPGRRRRRWPAWRCCWTSWRATRSWRRCWSARPTSPSTAPQQAGFLASLGELRLSKLDNKEGAMVAFRDALERQPEPHQGAGRAAGAAGRRRSAPGRGGHPGAAGRGARRLRRAGLAVRGARGPGGQRAGEGAVVAPGGRRSPTSKLDDRERAIEALGQALKEDPSAPDTAEALERVAVAAGQADGRRPSAWRRP